MLRRRVCGRSAGIIVAPSNLDTVCAGGPESLTLTVTFSESARVGMPEMTPVGAFSASPRASTPPLIAHRYPPAPPTATSAAW